MNERRRTSAEIKVAAILTLLLLCVRVAPGQQELDEEFPPGLLARYSASGKSIERVDSDISFVWNADSPDPRLPAGEFTAEWNGHLLVREAVEFRFHAFVSGEVDVDVDGKRVLTGRADRPGWVSGAPVSLGFGERKFRVTYHKTSDSARLSLFWSSSAFPVEPIPYFLFFRDGQNEKLASIERDRQSFDAHRCNRCHLRENDSPALAAPSLEHLAGNIDTAWLISQIVEPSKSTVNSKMPEFGFSIDEGRAIAAFLLSNSPKVEFSPLPERQAREKKEDGTPIEIDERREGEILFRSLGCLACHRQGELGNDGPYSGGNLSAIGEKRSREWFFTWLAEPRRLNADHTMPTFKLSSDERRSLAIYLSSLASSTKPAQQEADAILETGNDIVEKGRKLVEAARCAACHRIGGFKPDLAGISDLSREVVDLQKSCLTQPPDSVRRRPLYKNVDGEAIFAFLNSRTGQLSAPGHYARGARLLEQRNCISCHERGPSKGIVDTAGRVVRVDEQLKGESQALIPPALTAVGDKLVDAALGEAVSGDQKSVRLPWLRVRMPRFLHSDDDRKALLEYLVEHDRIPDGAPVMESPAVANPLNQTQLLLDGHSLVGPKGFVCVACHELGTYKPRNVSLGTHGSNLLMLGQRMRKPYYMRWTRGPLRVVPGMEMPSYSRPLAGILGNDVDAQLAATWDALNDPRFVPPANPTVIEQSFTVESGERPRIIHDVFTNPKENGGGYIPRALAIGFNNGHSILYDLDRGAVRQWTIGEFAQQRTQGKSWFWDMAGVPVLQSFGPGSDLAISLNPTISKLLTPRAKDATLANLENYRIVESNGEFFVELNYQIAFEYRDALRRYLVKEVLRPLSSLPSLGAGLADQLQNTSGSGWLRSIAIESHNTETIDKNSDISFSPQFFLSRPKIDERHATVHIDVAKPKRGLWISVKDIPGREFTEIPNDNNSNTVSTKRQLALEYRSELARDSLKLKSAAPQPAKAIEKITTVPGYDGVRLPIDAKIMPTAIAWTADGTLAFASLKGHVYLARDTDGDGLEDKLVLFEEGLAAPYGIIADGKDLIVAHKPELLRLRDTDSDGRADERTVIASGWGYTENYHDWTTGIVRDGSGNLYVGLGSDYTQRDRPRNMAQWRGKVLRIAPDGQIAPIGHAFRYPTGLAIDDKGRIFVSDNQGEQNTFNEINHLVEGNHYGKPSRWEEDPNAPAIAPAIQVPHPWTRSVNGLFFLDAKAGGMPLAGHGIGCEYDSRFLVRFTLQEVEGVVQGATYYFSRPNGGVGPDNFLGPLCGAVSPKGDIYIGSVWDSGWQGGQNTGDIVRLRSNGALPNGVCELRATNNGFEIRFVAPIDMQKALLPSSYNISGYTRIWKGGYATPDSGRHTIEIKSVNVSADGTIVHLHTAPLREGHVYEVNCGNIVSPGTPPLWPDTGHYTLHRIPK